MGMRLPTTVRYGARAVTHLAAAYPHHAISVREVGEGLGVSPKFLEHILRALKAAGLVQAVHGKQGGYVLARSPGSITLKDLYESLAGALAPVHCVDHPDSCSKRDDCPTRETWVELKDAIERVLERTTVQDLLERKRRRSVSLEQMYYV
jgi:Rrf2 family protein